MLMQNISKKNLILDQPSAEIDGYRYIAVAVDQNDVKFMGDPIIVNLRQFFQNMIIYFGYGNGLEIKFF